ncbi:M20 family metallopeptidase [Rubritalea marina]|uniref:M20 family metallopeptidase n=1 Tax=Rubritalea marina TaxID=361055 RepID=UPI00035C738E|nr:M20 family metallopeptidase [Rubritalea marina]
MNTVELLQQLIRIPSVNPDNDPGTDQVGEQAIADFLEDLLNTHGFTVQQEEVMPERPNLIARCPGSDDRPRIFLGPHLDTVGVTGMDFDPFCGDLRCDTIIGRGASDTKGPMAAMLTALIEHKELLAELPVAIDFVAFMAEESAQHGSKHFAEWHAHEYVFGIAGEPTSLDIVYTTKGCLWATVAAKGQAAHASQPERGSNAIMTLAAALQTLHTDLRKELAGYDHPVLGPSSINIGTIQGGTRPNIVPDHAEAEIDIRLTPSLHEAGGAAKILQQFIAERQLPLEVTQAHQNPPMETRTQDPFIQQLIQANPATQLVGAPWFSDAAHLANAGIPSICLGPGSINQAHTKDEFIKIADLEAGHDYFSKFIQSFRDMPMQ